MSFPLAEPSTASISRAFEHRAVGVRQRERYGQSTHRRRVGVRPGAPLEIGDAAGAHRRALGEGLLCEPGRDAVAPEDVAEPGPCLDMPPRIGIVPQTASDCSSWASA